MGARVVAAFSIIGGLAFAVATVLWVERPMDLAVPVGYWAVFASFVAFGGLAIAIWGLIGVYNERMAGPVAVVGAVGGLGSAMAAFGAIGAFILLPIGSTPVVLDLARHHVMGPALAIGHAVAAVAVMILLVQVIVTGTPVGSPSIYLVLLYPLTWLGIGISLLRGQPVIDEPKVVGSPS